jgi:hypothetical protein
MNGKANEITVSGQNLYKQGNLLYSVYSTVDTALLKRIFINIAVIG